MTKSYQQAEDEYFDRLWLEAQQLAPKPQYNSVTRPRHYMLFEDKGIEVRDVIEKLVFKTYIAFDEEKGTVLDSRQAPMFDADYVQMLQYVMRFMDKNGVEDLKKAEYYLKKMIEAYDSNS
jgi:hypothetical protein